LWLPLGHARAYPLHRLRTLKDRGHTTLWLRYWGCAGHTRKGRELRTLDRSRALIRISLLVDIRALHMLDLRPQQLVLQWGLTLILLILLEKKLPPCLLISHLLLLLLPLPIPLRHSGQHTTPTTNHSNPLEHSW
jgi:hypothetical protein